MKKILFIVALFVGLLAYGQNPLLVNYTFINGAGQTQNVKQVSFTPFSLGVVSNSFLTTNEIKVVITNSTLAQPLISGFAYRVKYFSTIYPEPIVSAIYTNYFPTNLTGTVNASAWVAISTNLGNGVYALTKAQADTLYAPIGSASGTNAYATNALNATYAVQATNLIGSIPITQVTGTGTAATASTNSIISMAGAEVAKSNYVNQTALNNASNSIVAQIPSTNGFAATNRALQNFIWVDSASGNDSTAQRANYAKPWATLTNALNFAQYGDRIYVSGTHYFTMTNTLIPAGVSIIGLNGAALLVNNTNTTSQTTAVAAFNVGNNVTFSGLTISELNPHNYGSFWGGQASAFTNLLVDNCTLNAGWDCFYWTAPYVGATIQNSRLNTDWDLATGLKPGYFYSYNNEIVFRGTNYDGTFLGAGNYSIEGGTFVDVGSRFYFLNDNHGTWHFDSKFTTFEGSQITTDATNILANSMWGSSNTRPRNRGGFVFINTPTQTNSYTSIGADLGAYTQLNTATNITVIYSSWTNIYLTGSGNSFVNGKYVLSTNAGDFYNTGFAVWTNTTRPGVSIWLNNTNDGNALGAVPANYPLVTMDVTNSIYYYQANATPTNINGLVGNTTFWQQNNGALPVPTTYYDTNGLSTNVTALFLNSILNGAAVYNGTNTTFTGNGSGLTNISLGNITGTNVFGASAYSGIQTNASFTQTNDYPVVSVVAGSGLSASASTNARGQVLTLSATGAGGWYSDLISVRCASVGSSINAATPSFIDSSVSASANVGKIPLTKNYSYLSNFVVGVYAVGGGIPATTNFFYYTLTNGASASNSMYIQLAGLVANGAYIQSSNQTGWVSLTNVNYLQFAIFCSNALAGQAPSAQARAYYYSATGP